jgi:hypothetical protein
VINAQLSALGHRHAASRAAQRLRLRFQKLIARSTPSTASVKFLVFVGLLRPGRSLRLRGFDAGDDFSDPHHAALVRLRPGSNASVIPTSNAVFTGFSSPVSSKPVRP